MVHTNAQNVVMQAILKWLLSNKTGWLLVCMATGAMLIVPLSVQAQDEELTDVGTRWVLLVGIADYPSTEAFEIQKLKAPVKDVAALAAFLGDAEKGGFDPAHILTLTDAEATRREILINFNDIANRAGPEDMVIFYFSGHGIRLSDEGTTYLVPYDHDLRDPATTCIDFDDLSEKIRKMEANKVVVILDACHSGGVKQIGARETVNTDIVKRYLEAFRSAEGRALLLSSDESQVSWETEDNGIFTRFLLEGLGGEADVNNDGIVTFTEAAAYVQETVPRYTREEFGRVQTPTRRYDLGQVRGDIPLAINWNKVSLQKQKRILNDRNTAIFQVDLEEDLEEFSLQMAQSAHDKAIKGEELIEQDSKLLKQLDKLKDGAITAAEYTTRARAIHSLTLTQLWILVTPADALVTLAPADAPDSVIAPSSPNAYQAKQGRYLLSTEREGYASDSREFALQQGSKEVKVELERLMGTLKLRVEPADAEVTVIPVEVPAPDKEARTKGIRVKPTGGTDVRNLPVGTYRVTAEKEGFGPAATELVEIKANTATPVTLALNRSQPVKQEPARITALGLPAGTRVLINGATVALPYDIPPGTHKIRLERDGFKPYEMSRTLNPSQSVTLNPQWVLKTGRLQLSVDPPDAAVKIIPVSVVAPDTKSEGSKRIRVRAKEGKELPVGTYRVVAEKEGYENAVEESVVIEMDAFIKVTLVLKPLKTVVSPNVPNRTMTPLRPVTSSRGIPRIGTVAASLLVPGLGQHLQGHGRRGFAYEVATVGVGAVALWAIISYNGKLDDYKELQKQLRDEAPNNTEFTTELSNLTAEQNDAHDKAESARSLAAMAQIAFAVIWGLNVVDAGVIGPAQHSSGLAFEAYPTSDGGQVVVSMSF